MIKLLTSEITAVSGSEPISLADAKAHLRVLHADDDAYITALIAAARMTLERKYRRTIRPQSITAFFDVIETSGALDYMTLPQGPVTAITDVQYRSAASSWAVWDSAKYEVFYDNEYCLIQPAPGQALPAYHYVDGGPVIKCRYSAGYAAAPSDIQHAVKLLVGHYYEQRAPTTSQSMTEIPWAIDALMPSRGVRV